MPEAVTNTIIATIDTQKYANTTTKFMIVNGEVVTDLYAQLS